MEQTKFSSKYGGGCMQLEKEIERAVRHQIALNREAPKSTAEIKSIFPS